MARRLCALPLLLAACAAPPEPEGLWDISPVSVAGVDPGSSAVACVGGYCTEPAVADAAGSATWPGGTWFPFSGRQLSAGVTVSVTGQRGGPACAPRQVSFRAAELDSGDVVVNCGAAALTIACRRHE